jgi:hypothetical protein
MYAYAPHERFFNGSGQGKRLDGSGSSIRYRYPNKNTMSQRNECGHGCGKHFHHAP